MASITFEIECEIEATIIDGAPSVGICGPQIDDLTLSSVSMLVAEGKPFGTVKYRSVDLLHGLDPKSRDIVIANILGIFGNDAEEAAINDL